MGRGEEENFASITITTLAWSAHNRSIFAAGSRIPISLVIGHLHRMDGVIFGILSRQTGAPITLVHREKQRMHCGRTFDAVPSTRLWLSALPLDTGRRGRDPTRSWDLLPFFFSRGPLTCAYPRAIPRARRNSARVAPFAGISPHVQEDPVPQLRINVPDDQCKLDPLCRQVIGYLY